MDSMVTFYREQLNLTLLAKFQEPVELAFFDLDGTRLMLERSEETGSSVIYLAVHDIESTTAALRENGVEILQNPRAVHHDGDGTFGNAGESEFMAFVKDPSGNTIALVERKRPS